MAAAKVYCPGFDVFNPPTIVQGGWSDTFPVLIHGVDVPNGSMVDSVAVSFLDSDNATALQAKIRDAVIALATRRGVTVPVNAVVGYSTPARL